jgi:hypothetical protein
MAKWARTADALHAAALASHVVCCGAPLALNVAALAFGAGLLTATWPWMDATHGALHAREGLLLGASGALVAVGGIVQYLSWRADCGRDACRHEPCKPKKSRRLWVYGLVCALFLGNLALFAWHQDRAGDLAHAPAPIPTAHAAA